MEACFAACDPQESTGQGVPTTQAFITKTTQELQEARAICGDSRPRGAAPHPGDDAGCVSASMSQGSAGPHLRSVSGLRVWAAARVPHTATFVCLLACRAWRWPISATCDVSWRPRKLGTTPFWRRWRWSSRNLPSPQSLLRLRVLAAHEESFLQRTPLAAPTLLHLLNQVTSSKLV